MERKKPFITTTPGVCLTAMLCCVLWGSAFPCIKTGYRLFHIDGNDVASNVFLSILIAAVVFRQEKLDRRNVIGCIIGFAGVVLINVSQGGIGGGISLIGEGFILFSAAAYGVSSVLIKIYSREDNPVMLSGWQFFCGGMIMIICGYLAGGRVSVWTAGSISMLVYLAAVSAVAYSLWGILLKHNPVSRVAVFGFMNPVAGVLLSAVILKEGGQAFGLPAVCALVLVCIGIYVVNSRKSDSYS